MTAPTSATPPRGPVREPCVLGIDLGTGSVKAALAGLDGTVHRLRSVPYGVAAPCPGWAETDPAIWEEATVRAVRELVEDVGGTEVRAVGLAGQMHGVVLSAADGTPLRPAVLWADSRASDGVAAYGGVPAAARARLANPVTPGMAGPILWWLAVHEPEILSAARWALQPKDWLRLRLTGCAHAEPSDASATLLYDVGADGWCDDVVDGLGLRRDLLAPLLPSGAVAGGLTAAAAAALGLPAGLPVVLGAADTAAAALGSGLAPDGDAQLTVGTGAQVVALLARPRADPSSRTHRYRAATPQGWYAMAAVQGAGLALDWAGRVLGLDAAALHDAAATVPPGADGLTFLPHLAGERTPHLDPQARGGWLGAGLEHGRPALARAVLEGVAFAVREGLEALEASGVATGALRLAGGGTLDGRWRQLLADVLGRPLTRAEDPAAAARGAALLALAAVDGAPPPTPLPPPRETVAPREHEAYADAYDRFRAAYAALRAAREARTP